MKRAWRSAGCTGPTECTDLSNKATCLESSWRASSPLLQQGLDIYATLWLGFAKDLRTSWSPWSSLLASLSTWPQATLLYRTMTNTTDVVPSLIWESYQASCDRRRRHRRISCRPCVSLLARYLRLDSVGLSFLRCGRIGQLVFYTPFD